MPSKKFLNLLIKYQKSKIFKSSHTDPHKRSWTCHIMLTFGAKQTSTHFSNAIHFVMHMVTNINQRKVEPLEKGLFPFYIVFGFALRFEEKDHKIAFTLYIFWISACKLVKISRKICIPLDFFENLYQRNE